jgi:hypothetical protein
MDKMSMDEAQYGRVWFAASFASITTSGYRLSQITVS